MIKFYITVLMLFASMSLCASEVKILSVQADCDVQRQCVFKVTISHADTGWQHYANYWQVVNKQGDVLVERTLYHPHVDEQPFTRSSSPVLLSRELKKVWIKAGDNVEGLNSKPYLFKLP